MVGEKVGEDANLGQFRLQQLLSSLSVNSSTISEFKGIRVILQVGRIKKYISNMKKRATNKNKHKTLSGKKLTVKKKQMKNGTANSKAIKKTTHFMDFFPPYE